MTAGDICNEDRALNTERQEPAGFQNGIRGYGGDPGRIEQSTILPACTDALIQCERFGHWATAVRSLPLMLCPRTDSLLGFVVEPCLDLDLPRKSARQLASSIASANGSEQTRPPGNGMRPDNPAAATRFDPISVWWRRSRQGLRSVEPRM